MAVIIAIAVVLWFMLGNPDQFFADRFWPSDAAPWETVDAYYYPDRADLSAVQSRGGLGSVKECRAVVEYLAASFNDPLLQRGDYECGIGRLDDYAGFHVYRITAK